MHIEKYIVTPTDPFYKSVNEEYALYDNKLLSFMWVYDSTNPHNIINKGLHYSSYDLETGVFKKYTPMNRVHFVFLKKEKDNFFFFDDLTHNVLIDMKRMEYAISSEYPFCIHLLEGNHIENCVFDDGSSGMKCLTFHGVTDYYEGGLYIYDPVSNTFNSDAFWELKQKVCIDNDEEEWSSDEEDNRLYQYEPYQYSNNQTSLHKKCVLACCQVNNKLYIVYYTEYNNLPHEDILAEYDISTGVITDIRKVDSGWKMCTDGKDNLLYFDREGLCIFNVYTKEEIKIKCDINGCVRFMGINDNKLIVITGFKNQNIYKITL